MTDTEKKPRTREDQVSELTRELKASLTALDSKLRVELMEAEERGAAEQQRKETEIDKDRLADLIEGMEVSVDVSTCDEDAGHRLFGTVTVVQEYGSAKNGLILLVQEAEPNFYPHRKDAKGQEPVARVDGAWPDGLPMVRALEAGRDLVIGTVLYANPPCVTALIEEAKAKGAAEARAEDAKKLEAVAYYIDHRPGLGTPPYAVKSLTQCAFHEMAEPVYTHPANVASLEARIKELEAQLKEATTPTRFYCGNDPEGEDSIAYAIGLALPFDLEEVDGWAFVKSFWVFKDINHKLHIFDTEEAAMSALAAMKPNNGETL